MLFYIIFSPSSVVVFSTITRFITNKPYHRKKKTALTQNPPKPYLALNNTFCHLNMIQNHPSRSIRSPFSFIHSIFFKMLMARVDQSIFGSQRELQSGTTEERGEGGAVKWYSLIDRGARDSVCERNSKKSPRDEGGVHGGRECKGGRSMTGWRHRARKLHCVLSD